jgi:hypothetical protein
MVPILQGLCWVAPPKQPLAEPLSGSLVYPTALLSASEGTQSARHRRGTETLMMKSLAFEVEMVPVLAVAVPAALAGIAASGSKGEAVSAPETPNAISSTSPPQVRPSQTPTAESGARRHAVVDISTAQCVMSLVLTARVGS